MDIEKAFLEAVRNGKWWAVSVKLDRDGNIVYQVETEEGTMMDSVKDNDLVKTLEAFVGILGLGGANGR